MDDWNAIITPGMLIRAVSGLVTRVIIELGKHHPVETIRTSRRIAIDVGLCHGCMISQSLVNPITLSHFK
ncbi:hypothetical protein PJP08_29400, partial [Mycobacterium kansasii]